MAVPMCPGCRALLSPEEASCPYCGWNVRATEVRREGGVVERALRPLGGLLPVLIGANVLLYLGTVAAHMALAGGKGVDGFLDAVMGPDGRTLALLGANVPRHVEQGQAWRLLCPNLLHGGILHIAVNMLSLRNIGGVVVEAYGTGKALALYLLTGVAGNLASVAWVHWAGGGAMVPRIRVSGAILGVAGLIAALGFRIGGEQGKALWKPMVRAIGLMLVLGFILSQAGSSILLDNTAHVGGFVGGLAAGFVCTFGVRARGDLAAVRAWDATAIVLSALTLLSFVPPALMLAEALRRM